MSKIWLVGAGPMARDYMKVLESLQVDYLTVGRGEKSALECAAHTNKQVVIGGLDKFLATQPTIPTHAIVAVPVQELYACAMGLIEYGVKEILIEKPAGLNSQEVAQLNSACENNRVNLVLAYNRRFYASVEKAKQMILEDGGATSCVFEFTEWSHVIEKLDKPEAVFQHWFLGNSTHVVDLAFYLIGKPKTLTSYVKGSVAWHKSGSIFVGSGESENGVLFSYHANWTAPGRWSVEVLTSKRRYIFKPMEELKVIALGTVKEENVELDGSLDKEFKPGLYLETQRFLTGDCAQHCSIGEQNQLMIDYYRMAGYDK